MYNGGLYTILSLFASNEQRERERHSISSLLINRRKYGHTKKEPFDYSHDKIVENLMFDLRLLSRMPLTGIKRVSSTWDTLQT